MKTLLNYICILMLPISLVSCASTTPNRIESKLCPKNTQRQPISFMLVVLDKEKNGLPIDVVIPTTEVDFIDFKNPKVKYTSIIKKGHEVRQNEIACWRAVVKDPNSAIGYKPTKQQIALLWRPAQKIKFGYTVKERIPLNNPIDIAYKYTVATKASKPSKGETYLDPRMVVRIRR